MKALVGSYNNGIYELEISNNKIQSSKKIKFEDKSSYITKYKDGYAYIFNKNDLQYIFIDNQELLLNEGACHLSFDPKNNLFYVSFYGAGLLKVLKQVDGLWQIDETFTFEKGSHVHYAQYIESIDLVGVCDLGLNTFSLYKVTNQKLELVNVHEFHNNEGPRHFIQHPLEPRVYVLNELNPSISTFEYINNELVLIDHLILDAGYGSAIRMDSNNEYLYAAVRDSNVLYSFKVLKNGLLEFHQKVHTYGNHPRDFNLIGDESLLLVANMKSDNLTLFSINNGYLELLEKDYPLLAGSTVI